jgi:predicted AAA+ superfamily ATPase
VAILGPRQVGKTTLAKTLSKTYYDLELEQERLKLDIQWDNPPYNISTHKKRNESGG